MTNPLVAIVGRPNVGKSTLFNRLGGSRDAIVSDVPGTTRDRLLAEMVWDDCRLTIVDTGGLEPRPQDPLREKVKAQVEAAVEEAEIIIFLMDAVDGLNPMDEEIADWLRRTHKPVIAAVNKVDNQRREASGAEFYSLGLGDPHLISAYHNLGVHDLMDHVVGRLPPSEELYPDEEESLKLAIIGRTNVGKSMLTNAILGQDRAIVSEIPGTTRDALDTQFIYDGAPVTLIDTAGIRRPGKVGKGIEYYSTLRSTRAVQRCDIALLIMDAAELATAQDAHVSGYAWDAYRGIVAVINKWDLRRDGDAYEKEEAIQIVRRRLHFMPYVPITFTSALNGVGVDDLVKLALAIYKERTQRVPPDKLNRTLMDAMADHMPPARRGRRLRITQVRQLGANPPTFVFAVSDPKLVHFSYERFLENRLRNAFGYTHTHLRLVFRQRI